MYLGKGIEPAKEPQRSHINHRNGERAGRERELGVMPQDHPPQGRMGLRGTASEEPSQPSTGDSCEKKSAIWQCCAHKTNHFRHGVARIS